MSKGFRIILNLLALKVKKFFYLKGLFLFFHSVVFLLRALVTTFKGGSDLHHKIKRVSFGELRDANYENSIAPNYDRLAVKKNLLSVEELDKIRSRYFFILQKNKIFLSTLTKQYILRRAGISWMINEKGVEIRRIKKEFGFFAFVVEKF